MFILPRFAPVGLALLGFAALSLGQGLTIQVGTPPAPPTSLVRHNDVWAFHKGTNPPQANWQTIADASLNSDWASAPGGFGYGDNGITNNPGVTYESTLLTDMINRYSTLFIRRSFNVTTGFDPNARLLLTMDYDDGFVAYLDGVEIARANTTNAVGSVVTATQTTGSNSHEASCCNAPTSTPAVFDLGTVSNRLATGTHTLAIVGLNQSVGSSDFHLIADLSVEGQGGSVANNGFYALTADASVTMSGSNTVAGSTRLTVNGNDASFNPGTGLWTNSVPLAPGHNRLYVAALDSSGNVLSNRTQIIVRETSRILVGGTLTSNLLASGAGTILHVASSVVVPTGLTLEVANGAVVLVNPGASLIAQNGGRILAHGTFDQNVFFHVHVSSTGTWGPLSAAGTNSTLELHFADVARSQVSATAGAYGLLEDSSIHDFDPGAVGILNRPILMCNYASLFEVRRCHIRNYYECLVRNGVIQVEECLFENIGGDALDFDSAQPGSYTRNCTYRHGVFGNVDAVDIGPGDLPGSTDTRIENCIMWNFPFDKGVSVGDGGSSHGIIVSNCLIYSCNAGVMAKDRCDVSVRHCTIVGNDSGLTNYNKANPTSPTGGGITTNTYNNIVWNNRATIGMANGGQLFADHNDFGNTNWPGIGNFDADPLFVDAARGNYRLQSSSPARGSGRGGADLGVTYPLGGIPMTPLALAAVITGTNAPVINWVDDSQNEEGVVIQRSADGSNWLVVAQLPAEATNFLDESALAGQKYFYRAQHTNYVAASPYSNIATGQRQDSGNRLVGGALATNVSWSGTIVVTSSVVVPNGLTLTVQPGTQVRIAASLSITAQAGGTINVQGSARDPVRFIPNVGSTAWGNLSGTGNGATVTIRHAELWRGGINLGTAATGLIEDCYIHEVSSAIVANSAALVTVRRVHVSHFGETIYNSTLVLVEDSLFENLTSPSSDAVELQGAPPGCIVRRCTLRNGSGANTDAFDCNGSRNVLIADCVIHSFTDKAISFGSAGQGGQTSSGMVVSNCLIYNVNIGIALKDSATASFYHNTIVDSASGLSFYQKFVGDGGGHMTNGFNNILFNNTTNVGLYDGSTLVMTYSDIEGTNYPGVGNVSVDPRFLNESARDFRLALNSPVREIGLNRRDMGALFPIGSVMAASHPVLQPLAVSNKVSTIAFWADPVRTYTLQCATNLTGAAWTAILTVPTNHTSRLVNVTNTVSAGSQFYRLASP